MNVNDIYDLSNELENESHAICAKLVRKPIVVLPAGRFIKIIIKTLGSYGIKVSKIADNDPLKHGRVFEVENKNYEIESLKDVLAECGNDYNYVIKSRGYRDELVEQLKQNGIQEDNIFDAPVYLGDLLPQKSFLRKLEVKENAEQINEALNNLYDEESKQELAKLLAILIANAPVFKQCNSLEEYFNVPYIKLGEKEIFVDGGMYDGQTTKRFVELCPSYSKVYGFEANKEQIEKINENLKEYRDIVIYEKAVYSKADKLCFKSFGEGSRLEENGECMVETVSIDECNLKPTYVKLDIEGAEYDAIEGMKNTIKNCSPKMAVAIYHSLEDHWRLINKMKEIDPEYKIAVKHHYGYEILYGTNLYAWK